MSTVTDLFRNKGRDEHGIMDIGKNCTKCNELDLLPFVCEECKQVFCAKCRKVEAHQCPGVSYSGAAARAKEAAAKSRARGSPSLSNSTAARARGSPSPTAASLFPDRSVDRQIIDAKLTQPAPSNILTKQFRVGDVAAKTPNAFTKFNRFLKSQQAKKSPLSKLFKKLTPAATNKVVQISLLRKQAKGDSKIPQADRIYLWCLYINPKKTESETSELEELAKINVEKDRRAVFVAKTWPVGRALDVIADTLAIRNYNNSTTNSDERLNIFRLEGEEVVLVETGERCGKNFKDCDVVYLVKGRS
jgi:predicted nucleic acid binding AN1-type Zn finger protein